MAPASSEVFCEVIATIGAVCAHEKPAAASASPRPAPNPEKNDRGADEEDLENSETIIKLKMNIAVARAPFGRPAAARTNHSAACDSRK